MTGQNEWHRQQRIDRNRAARLATMAEAQKQADARNAKRSAEVAR